MSNGYMSEKANTTLTKLMLDWGNLRERLPEAYDHGVSLLSVSEVSSLDIGLGDELRTIREQLYAEAETYRSGADIRLSVVSDESVTALATRIVDFVVRLDNAIEIERSKR